MLNFGMARVSKTYIFLGSALYNLQKFQEAINCFDISINLNPTISNALNGKGNNIIYLYDGHYIA